MDNYLESAIKQFRYYKDLGERAMEQIDEEALFYQPSEDDNSIAIIVKHLHGNMLSRWTDPMNTDGEKVWRNRDDEFVSTIGSRDEVYALWDEAWSTLFNAIGPLSHKQLTSIIFIRNEGHTMVEAINRQLCHYAYHIGQMVYLGKMAKGSKWVSLSISKGGTEKFNKNKFDRPKSQKHFTDDE